MSLEAAPIRYGQVAISQSSQSEILLTGHDMFMMNNPNTNRVYARRGRHTAYDRSCMIDIDENPRPASPVPEPLSLVLIGSGMMGVGFFARRKAHKNLQQ